MGTAAEVAAALERGGLALEGRFTLPDEAWWDDFYTPMEVRIAELLDRYRNDEEARGILKELAAEPEMHRRFSYCYAYEFFIARPLSYTRCQS